MSEFKEVKKKKAPESEVVEIKTTKVRLGKISEIYRKGKVRSVAHDADLMEKLDEAKKRKRPATKPDDGYREYNRVRRKLSKDPQFKGKEVHHIDYPRKDFKDESLDPRNLLLTDKKTHIKMHKAVGKKGIDMFREKEFAKGESKKVRVSVNDFFNFQNPKSQVKLEDVKDLLKKFRRRR